MFCLNTYFEIVYVRILSNHPLSCVEEFFNLYSSLGGIAENVITCSMTTSDSYQVVWNSLTTRYNNKNVLVQVHVKSLFELEPIKKESSSLSGNGVHCDRLSVSSELDANTRCTDGYLTC